MIYIPCFMSTKIVLKKWRSLGAVTFTCLVKVFQADVALPCQDEVAVKFAMNTALKQGPGSRG